MLSSVRYNGATMETKSLGFIMDGNRRWAKAKGLDPWDGHKAGVNTFINTLKWLEDTEVEHVAYYAFSSENWKRSEQEISELMKLFSELLIDRREELLEQNIRVRFIGDRKKLSNVIRRAMSEIEKISAGHRRTVWICLSYGGRDELIAAARRPSSWFGNFENNLWSAEMPDLDLVIRTGGNQRLSNFLLWKAAYAELSFTDTLWPDLQEQEFKDILEQASERVVNNGA